MLSMVGATGPSYILPVAAFEPLLLLRLAAEVPAPGSPSMASIRSLSPLFRPGGRAALLRAFASGRRAGR